MTDIFYTLRNKDRYVYHYTRACPAVAYILPFGTLRFSRFELLNDPREAEEWALGYFRSHSTPEPDQARFRSTIDDMMKKRWRVGCFASDTSEATNHERPVQAKWERGHSRPRMWSQYAQGYSGVCLVFDKQKLDARIRTEAGKREVFAKHVTYRNPDTPSLDRPEPMVLSLPPNGDIEAAAMRHIQLHRQALFFQKATDWTQECEYRWLVEGDGDTDFFVRFDDALVGVVIGDKCDKPAMRAIGHYLLERKLNQVAFMKWQNGIPEIAMTSPRPLSEGIALP